MIRLLAWVVDAIVIVLIVRALMRLFGGGRSAGRWRPPSRSIERAGGTLVRDPQCGTYIPESHALPLRSGGETIYFCSAACRDAFQHRA